MPTLFLSNGFLWGKACRNSALIPHNVNYRNNVCRLYARHGSLASFTTPPSLRHVITQAAGDFFNSEVVQRDFERLNKDMLSLSSMMHKFADFDLEGKRIFLEQMDDFVERFRIFSTRLRLTDDPMAQGMVRQLNIQLLEANVNLDSMYQGFKQQTEHMRRLLDEEERITDPAALSRLRSAYRESFGGAPSPVTRFTSSIAANYNPEELMGVTDPKAILALQEITEDPSAVEKYKDRPALYRLLKKLLNEQ